MTRSASPFLLDVVLYPHCSLSRRGFLVLLAAFGVVSFAVGVVFASMGAWPVLGFFGLDVALFYCAFRLNYRSARHCEIIRVTRQQLTVRRVQSDGRQKVWRFEPAWSRVALHRPDDRDCRLELASGQQSITLGSFLPPDERVSFAGILRQALRDAQTYPRPF
jgi:uncharacterized membrane protein